jgi:hypothetical protein
MVRSKAKSSFRDRYIDNAAISYTASPAQPSENLRGQAKQKLRALVRSKMATGRAWMYREIFDQFRARQFHLRATRQPDCRREWDVHVSCYARYEFRNGECYVAAMR